MALLKPVQADALFGVFLQDIRNIREKYPGTFKNRYYLFEYAEISADRYGLFIQPEDIPKKIRKEIEKVFDLRLNVEKAPKIMSETYPR